MTSTIRAFEPADQEAARTLILEGLGGYFGFIDESMNPDLDDIRATYLDAGDCFLVAEIDGELVGTGALIEEEPGVGRLARMSVAPAHRGKGLGRALVNHLLDEACSRGYHQVVWETNHDWHDAIGLYLACGFTEIGVRDGDRHFVREIESSETIEAAGHQRGLPENGVTFTSHG